MMTAQEYYHLQELKNLAACLEDAIDIDEAVEIVRQMLKHLPSNKPHVTLIMDRNHGIHER
jgi:cytochrome c-type biogenesis protein CcmH/NrfG